MSRVITMRHATALVGLCAALVASAGALSFGAPAAQASESTVRGCPGGAVCGYRTKADYEAGINATEIGPIRGAVGIFGSGKIEGSGLEESGRPHPEEEEFPAVYNNSDPVYTSEGDTLVEIPGVLCVYVPDTNDEQAPDSGEVLTDGQSIDALAYAPTAAEADSVLVVPLSDCD